MLLEPKKKSFKKKAIIKFEIQYELIVELNKPKK